MPTIGEYLVGDAKGTLLASSRDGMWCGIAVDELYVRPNIEATTPAQNQLVIGMVVSGITKCFERRGTTRHSGTVGPGSAMILPAGDTAYFRTDSAHTTSTTIIPSELLSSAAEAMGMSGKGKADIASAFDLRDRLITDVISIFIDELHRPAHPSQSLVVSAAAKALAAHLIRMTESRTVPRRTSPILGRRQLAAVREYANGIPVEEIDLEAIADVANVASIDFTSSFKSSTGESPMLCLERLQIRRAQRLIRSGKMALSEIAAAVGFADQSSFVRRFLVHTGVTLKQYLRECKR